MDPFAAAFVAARAEWQPPSEVADARTQAIVRHIVIRTRFFDDMLLDAARNCQQVVLLGAGLDARAFRLSWPEGTRLFELDQSALLSWKQDRLDAARVVPACERTTVATDLRADWPSDLAGAGHDPDEPTAWLAEGLLVYLAEDVVERLIVGVSRRSAPGSRFGLTIRKATSIAPPGPLTEMWISTTPDDPLA